jgi:hypothetical protein
VTGQTSIPVSPPPDRGPCAWCGTETNQKLTLRKGSPKGSKTIRVAQEVWCCTTHLATLKRTEDA